MFSSPCAGGAAAPGCAKLLSLWFEMIPTHPPTVSREGAEMLIFGSPCSESFSLVASPEMLETEVHFLFRKRTKISPKVQPPALATSSINRLHGRALLLFVLVAFSL